MSSFLIDKTSPIKSGIPPKLRHRSRHSECESENVGTESQSVSQQNNDDGSSGNKRNGEDKDPTLDTDADGHNHHSNRRSGKNKSMLGYFMTELIRDYKLEADASEFVERRDRVYTSVNTPRNLEKFCAFGFLQCLDSILYMVTFLPLRIIVAIVRVLTYPCALVFMGHRRILDGSQVCDLLKGVILIVSCFITSYMDMSMIYHIVRGQSIIKFYVFYNMLDVLDKLVSGFGQDVLDSLYWTAVEPRGRKREHFGTFFHLIFAIVYVVIHTMMILIQAIILNVAFNSHNKNLLTIMMSNNFVEIKGNLFKRLDKNNLCQITYSDVKERFHYLVLLLFVFIRNMKELQWSWELAFPIIQDAAIVMLVEVIVDWIKHAFITKFNELSASSYADFALGLAQDISSSQKKHAFTNFSDQVCRRMGFTPMPLICLLFMVCSKSFTINGPLPWLLVCLFYLCLISTKVLNSIILLGWAQRLITEREKTAASKGTVVNSQVVPKKEEKSPSSKAKGDTAPDMSVPLVITPRPSPISSSVAVNTDTTLGMEAISSVALMQPVSMAVANGNHSVHHSNGSTVQDGNFYDQKEKGLSPTAGDETIVYGDDFSKHPNVSGLMQSTLSLAASSQNSSSSASNIPRKLDPSAHQFEADVGDGGGQGVVKPVLMDFQTDFLTPQHSPAASQFPTSHLEKPPLNLELLRTTSSSGEFPSSPKRKHPDSPVSSLDSYFDSMNSKTAVENVSLQPDFPNFSTVSPDTCKSEKEPHEVGINNFQTSLDPTVLPQTSSDAKILNREKNSQNDSNPETSLSHNDSVSSSPSDNDTDPVLWWDNADDEVGNGNPIS